MEPADKSNLDAQGPFQEEGPPLRAPLTWHLRNLWLVLRIPLVLLAIIAGWNYIPQLEARSQQNALAAEFFAVCHKTLKETDQLPKVPEEALEEAIRRRPITNSALTSWSPQVMSEIRNGQWIARIAFLQPSGYVLEQTIGPVLAESGYDTPSAGP